MEHGVFWSIWWIWLCVAMVLGLLEILVPGFVFLGFAIGALLTSLLASPAGSAVFPSGAHPLLRGAVACRVARLESRFFRCRKGKPERSTTT